MKVLRVHKFCDKLMYMIVKKIGSKFLFLIICVCEKPIRSYCFLNLELTKDVIHCLYHFTDDY